MSDWSLSPDVAAVRDDVIAIRRDLHAHPELAFEEVRTAGVVAERLRALGLSPRTGLARTGVTAVIEGGAGPGPTVLLRADMDALPVQEESGLPFASTVPGKMHACGHDGHTAMLLGAAQVLVGRRERLRGRVKLFFQPAEEHPGGALPMIEAGALEDPRVDCAFAAHLWSPLPVGLIAASPGPVLAAADKFTITLRGRGGHAALPHETVDPVMVAGHVITAVHSLVSRYVAPGQRAVISLTTLRAGEAFNVIPETAVLGGTLRAFDERLRNALTARLEEVASHTAQAFGASATLEYERGYPPVVNDAAMTDVLRRAAAAVVGDSGVVPLEPVMGGEDFAYILERVPGCFFVVGARNAALEACWPHHHPRFAIDEAALGLGVATLVGAVQDLLG